MSKSRIKENKYKTNIMRIYYYSLLGKEKMKKIKTFGAYTYKNYEIFVNNDPYTIFKRKNVSIRETEGKSINQKDLEFIANYFIGENYTVQYGLFDNNTVNIWEEKGTIN